MKLTKPRRSDFGIEMRQVSHGACSFICVYINAAAKNAVLQLYL